MAMADREPRAATGDPGTQAATADRVYGPPPKSFFGRSPAGEYPVRASGDEGELGRARGDEGKLDETNSLGCSASADSLGHWRGAGTGGRNLGGARAALTLLGTQVALTLLGAQ